MFESFEMENGFSFPADRYAYELALRRTFESVQNAFARPISIEFEGKNQTKSWLCIAIYIVIDNQ